MLIEGFKRLSIPSSVLLILFFFACLIQLVFAFSEKENYRRIEKPLCLALLTAFAVVTLPNHPFIYIATFMGLLGDIFVILPNKKFFYLGAFTFFLGFIFYALEGLVILMNSAVPIYMIIVIVATYLVMFFALAFFIGPRLTSKRFDSIGIGLYLAPLITMLPIMVFLTAKGGGVMYLALIGIIFFMSSDFTITYTKFVKKFKRYDFYIMLTYLIGQVLIVLGFSLTYLLR